MQAAELRNDPFRRITVTPFTGTFGAEITNIDLNAIDDETTAEIRAALLRYSVVFFENQEFTPESQAAFARRTRSASTAVANGSRRREQVAV